jgi:uncharacterized protein involved in tolerance to divalent cations
MGTMADMTMEAMIWIDLAKSVFQVHGASMMGQLKFRKKLSRVQFRKVMAERLVASVVMEACSSAHYWAREISKHGHEVKLIGCGVPSIKTVMLSTKSSRPAAIPRLPSDCCLSC